MEKLFSVRKGREQTGNLNRKENKKNMENVGNIEKQETLAETSTGTTMEGQEETATYNTDEIFGVDKSTTETVPETTAETAPETIPETTGAIPVVPATETPTTGNKETLTTQTATEYQGVTHEDFEKLYNANIAGFTIIILCLCLIFGAIVGRGFDKLWKM